MNYCLEVPQETSECEQLYILKTPYYEQYQVETLPYFSLYKPEIQKEHEKLRCWPPKVFMYHFHNHDEYIELVK